MTPPNRRALIVILLLAVALVSALLLFTNLALYLRLQSAPVVPSTLTKQFTWTPAANTTPGPRTLTIVADDGRGGRTTKEVTIEVIGQGGTTPLAGDLNRDGAVNIDDLTLVTANFGQAASTPGVDQRADANADGVINIDDLTLVTTNFGKTSS